MTEHRRLRLATAARLVSWELRGSATRVLFWMLCLTVGVGAVVGVAGLGASLDSALRREARSLLAADLAIRSNADLPAELIEIVESVPGAELSEIRETLGLAQREVARETGASSLLIAIKAVAGGYPFYGELDVSPSLPEGKTLAEALGDEFAIVGQELLDRLGLEVGDSLVVGQATLRILAVVNSEPDRLPGTVAIGPRVFVSMESLSRSQFLGLSGFVRRKTLVGLAQGSGRADVEQLAQRLRSELGQTDPESDLSGGFASQGEEGGTGGSAAFVRIETYADAQPSLRRDLARLENFLGLAALLSLLIGGVGIAQGVSSWIASRIDSLAILKCLGLRPREVFGLYLVQAALLGLAGSLTGGLVGLLILWSVPRLLVDFVPADAITVFQPGALLRGLLLGVGVATAFSLPPLLSVLRVSPSLVFRRSAEPLPGSKVLPAVAFLVALVTVGALAYFQSESLLLASLFVAGVLVTVVGLALSALGLARLTRWVSRRRRRKQTSGSGLTRYWMRHGLASLSRPGAGTLGAIVALGLGLFVISTMALVQAHLRDQLTGALPKNAPSAFLVDIPPAEWPGLSQILEREGATSVQSVPVVRARIRSIDGVAATELVKSMERGDRWALTREQRLTYLDELPPDNQVLSGAPGGVLWSDPRYEVSVEEEFARELGIDIGSTLQLAVASEEDGGDELEDGEQQETQLFDFVVTSLRRVEWEGFGINFFLVVEPGVLEQVTQIRLAAAQIPIELEQPVQDAVAAAHPGVLFIRIREMLDKILILVGRLIAGIRVLGGFTILSGLAILFGAIVASHAERGRDVALMKTLGMTRFDVLRTYAVEYALVGLVSASIALLGALVVSWYVVARVMEIDWSHRPVLYLAVLLGGPLLSTVAGLVASVGALSKPPVQALRE